MKRRTNQALPYGRMYAQGREGIASERAFERLVPVLGRSAATTYDALRRYHSVPASLALSRARQQAQQLGQHYPGGLDCLGFRRPIL